MKIKGIVKQLLLWAIVPLIVILGVVIFNDRAYGWISLCVAVCGCIPFFLTFEKRQNSTTRLVIIAVLVALSVCPILLLITNIILSKRFVDKTNRSKVWAKRTS